MSASATPRHRYDPVTTASIAEVARHMRVRGEVIWPWPPSILFDDPDMNIETYLVAAMNYLKTLAACGMPRDEEEATALRITHGLIENGLRLTQARRKGLAKHRDDVNE